MRRSLGAATLSLFAGMVCVAALALNTVMFQAVIFNAGTLHAEELTVRSLEVADGYGLLPIGERPEVLGVHRGLTMTRFTDEQTQLLDYMFAPQGEGGVADVRDLVAVQFLYLDSTCDDMDAMAIRDACEGPCNMIGLRWNEDNFHETVTILMDDEFLMEVAGLADPPDGQVNGFNIFGIDAGTHTFRIEDSDTGTSDEVVFEILDAQPFGDPEQVECSQGAVNPDDGTCDVQVGWGQTNTPRATNFLVYFNDAPLTNVAGNFGGVILGGADPGEYCFDVRACYEPEGTDGDVVYIGCRISGGCCTIDCTEDLCPPVSFLSICQDTFDNGEGTGGGVVADWVNGQDVYDGGVALLVEDAEIGVLGNDGGNSAEGAVLSPLGDGETTISVQPICGEDERADAIARTLLILQETPYTSPVEGTVRCAFDPEGDDPGNPGETIPTTTASWTTSADISPTFIGVYVVDPDIAEGEVNRFFLGNLIGSAEELQVTGTDENDIIQLQFFSFFDTGCYGSEPIDCVHSDGSTRFIRGVCGNSNASPQISDPVQLLNWLFGGGTEPSCLVACDADGIGGLQLTDALRVLNFLFNGGPSPVGWRDNTATCENFSPATPGFDLGCEAAHPDCE